ncbi:MAG: peptide ABC transporter permease [Rhodomicrobium sp.]|nr:MAG: peptide ABC transporter permease [Rhodomicrobium sp.]
MEKRHEIADHSAASADEVPEELTPRLLMKRRMFRHKGFLLGTGLLFLLVLLAIFAPLIAPFDPFDQVLSRRLLPPVWAEGGGWEHLLGTDHLGRDYLSRLLYGARMSLIIGLGAATVGCVIGVTLGVCAGYFGGRIDQVIGYLLTCQLALPGLLLAMSLVFMIGPSVPVVISVIGLLHWTYYLVVTRAATMQIKQLDYIAAARTLGSSHSQIIIYEILPNLLNQIIVIFTLEIGIAVLAEAALSFLGVGIQPPIPSWGLMIAEGKNAMYYRPWLVILPGIAIFIMVISTNLMGDGLRDVTAPDNRS